VGIEGGLEGTGGGFEVDCIGGHLAEHISFYWVPVLQVDCWRRKDSIEHHQPGLLNSLTLLVYRRL
jgi:hypothetical protein